MNGEGGDPTALLLSLSGLAGVANWATAQRGAARAGHGLKERSLQMARKAIPARGARTGRGSGTRRPQRVPGSGRHSEIRECYIFV